jgi:hypothetical protein
LGESEDFQSRSTQEGRLAIEVARRAVTGAGFSITDKTGRRFETGAKVNLVASDKAGREWFFDVSGAFTTGRPGLMRTDTMWKTLGRANVLHGAGVERLLILTTNLPTPGSTGDKALRTAAHTFVDAIEMVTAEGKARLHEYAFGVRNERLPLPGYRTATEIYGSSLKYLTDGLIELPAEFASDAVEVRQRYSVATLEHRFRAYLPSQTRDGVPIRSELRADVGKSIVILLNDAAGGCTSSEGVGSWVDPISGIAHEAVTVIEAYSADPVSPSVLRDILDLIIVRLDQASAAILVNEKMYQVGRA